MEFIARPKRFPCGTCKLNCTLGFRTLDCLKCGECNNWNHRKCQNMNSDTLKAWTDSELDYLCIQCRSKDGSFNYDKGMGRLDKAARRKDMTQLQATVDREFLFDNSWTDPEQPGDMQQDTDQVAAAVLRDFVEGVTGTPVQTTEGCLFNAVSLQLIGNESLSFKLRYLTCIQLMKNVKLYMCHPMRRLVQPSSPTYASTCLNTGLIGGSANAWSVLALCDVIRCPIRVIYPLIDGKEDAAYRALNRTFESNVAPDRKIATIAVMWYQRLPGQSDTTKHFAAVLNINNTTSTDDHHHSDTDPESVKRENPWLAKKKRSSRKPSLYRGRKLGRRGQCTKSTGRKQHSAANPLAISTPSIFHTTSVTRSNVTPLAIRTPSIFPTTCVTQSNVTPLAIPTSIIFPTTSFTRSNVTNNSADTNKVGTSSPNVTTRNASPYASDNMDLEILVDLAAADFNDLSNVANVSTQSAPDPSLLDEPASVSMDIDQPDIFNESSMMEEDPADPSEHGSDSDDVPTWQIMASSTQRGGPKLVNSAGYTYVISKVRKTATDWACTVKNKQTVCKARVTERDGEFAMGSTSHCHPPLAGAALSAKLVVDVKAAARSDPFVSAAHIVDDAISKNIDPQEPCDLPKTTSLQRMANRCRESARPRHPASLDFELQLEAVPEDFVIADISCGSQRHLLMATTLMLTLLCSAKNWFMDATFRLVRAPFRQLFSIHAFVRQGDALKQVPLVYCLMSGKSKHDYRAVIKTVLKHLPRTPALTTITVDFEAAMWTAIRTELPAVTIKGCSFHWTQAVWRKIQDVGLVTTYNKKLSTHKFLKRVMALPFLPASAIRSMFATMKSAVENGSVLEKLMCYIENTWMNSTVWPIESWSVYGRSIRTNNDTEGWHRRLNNLAKGQNGLNMYMLIKVLHKEAVNVSFQVRFVSEGKLKRYQRRKYACMQGIIMKAWDDWETGNLTASGLLKTCARVHGPVNK